MTKTTPEKKWTKREGFTQVENPKYKFLEKESNQKRKKVRRRNKQK
jgi:hypothetical protein